jgi:hypothetical protein
MKRIKSKKAVSQWLSWILLTAFMVVLSVVVYDWYINYTKESITTMKQAVYNTDDCTSITMCLKLVNSTQDLNINITNNGYITIDRLFVRVYNSTDDFVQFEYNTTLKPDRTRNYIFNSTNVNYTGMGNVTYVEAVPIIVKDDLTVICSSRQVSNSSC